MPKEFQSLVYILYLLGGRNDRLNEFAMLIYIYNNAMRSCNESKTLHCVESYLYYIILVNKKIFSEEWNEGEKKIDHIYTLSKISNLYIRVLTNFPYLFRSEWKWIICFLTMYVYCIYRPKETVKWSKRAETSLVLIIFDCVLYEVRFISL